MHVNHTLPPVGVPLKVKIGGEFKDCIRHSWITRKDAAFEVELTDTKEIIKIKRGKIQWTYY